MELFNSQIIICIFFLWNGVSIVLSAEVQYCVGVILTFPIKITVLFDLKKPPPSSGRMIYFDYIHPRIFLTNIKETDTRLRESIQKNINFIKKSSPVVAGGVNLTVIGTDEFRYLKATNMPAFKAAVAAVNKVSHEFTIFDNKVKVLLVDNNDEAWSFYSMGMDQALVPDNKGLFIITRYKIVLVFPLNDALTAVSDYTSQSANNDGFVGYFSVQINCAGPEYMEIKSNNYFAREAKKKNIAAGSEIKFPCYPVGTRVDYEIGLNSLDYEYCDHDTYASHRPLKYFLIGAFNKIECSKLIDTIVTSKYGCRNIKWCTIKDLPSNILSYTLSEFILSLNMKVDSTQHNSQLTQAWIDAEIADACSSQYSAVPHQKFEKCFYMNYLNYVYNYLQLKQYNYTTISRQFNWYEYFMFGPKARGSGILPPGGCHPNKLTLGVILGIVFGVLIGLLLLGLIIFGAIKLSQRKTESYEVVDNQ